jgi:hypothetical protein
MSQYKLQRINYNQERIRKTLTSFVLQGGANGTQVPNIKNPGSGRYEPVRGVIYQTPVRESKKIRHLKPFSNA